MRLIFAVFALCFSAPVVAQNMPVNDFLAKADALGKQGALAVFSGDIKLLKAEIANSGHAWRDDMKAEAAAHKPPSSCPPPPPLALNSGEILKSFRSIPADQRAHMTVKTAFVRLVTGRYPCKS